LGHGITAFEQLGRDEPFIHPDSGIRDIPEWVLTSLGILGMLWVKVAVWWEIDS
jgi:hypothetical protein